MGTIIKTNDGQRRLREHVIRLAEIVKVLSDAHCGCDEECVGRMIVCLKAERSDDEEICLVPAAIEPGSSYDPTLAASASRKGETWDPHDPDCPYGYNTPTPEDEGTESHQHSPS